MAIDPATLNSLKEFTLSQLKSGRSPEEISGALRRRGFDPAEIHPNLAGGYQPRSQWQGPWWQKLLAIPGIPSMAMAGAAEEAVKAAKSLPGEAKAAGGYLPAIGQRLSQGLLDLAPMQLGRRPGGLPGAAVQGIMKGKGFESAVREAAPAWSERHPSAVAGVGLGLDIGSSFAIPATAVEKVGARLLTEAPGQALAGYGRLLGPLEAKLGLRISGKAKRAGQILQMGRRQMSFSVAQGRALTQSVNSDLRGVTRGPVGEAAYKRAVTRILDESAYQAKAVHQRIGKEAVQQARSDFSDRLRQYAALRTQKGRIANLAAEFRGRASEAERAARRLEGFTQRWARRLDQQTVKRAFEQGGQAEAFYQAARLRPGAQVALRGWEQEVSAARQSLSHEKQLLAGVKKLYAAFAPVGVPAPSAMNQIEGNIRTYELLVERFSAQAVRAGDRIAGIDAELLKILGRKPRYADLTNTERTLVRQASEIATDMRGRADALGAEAGLHASASDALREVVRESRRLVAEAKPSVSKAALAKRKETAEWWGIPVAQEAAKAEKQRLLSEYAAQGYNRGALERIVNRITSATDKRREALIRAGALDPESRLYEGTWLRLAYEKHMEPEQYARFLEQTDPDLAANFRAAVERRRGFPSPTEAPRIPGAVVEDRLLLPEAVREALHPLALDQRIAIAFKESGLAEAQGWIGKRLPGHIAREYGAAKGEGWKPLPEGLRYGELAGVRLPPEEADRLAYWTSTQFLKPFPKGGLRYWRVADSMWKAVHVPMNLPTVLRNAVTNLLLAYSIGKVPAQELPSIYLRGLRLFRSKGPDYWRLVGAHPGMGVESGFAAVEASLRRTVRPGAWNALKRGWNVAGDKYAEVEHIAKLGVADYWLHAGASPRQASELAVKAIFDYGDVDAVTNLVRSYGALPFATYTRKVLPGMAGAGVSDPGRVYRMGRALQAPSVLLESEPGVKEEREAIPPYMAKGRATPAMATPEGRRWADLSFWEPLGTLTQAPELFPVPRLLQNIVAGQATFPYPHAAPRSEIAIRGLLPSTVSAPVDIVKAARGLSQPRGKYPPGPPETVVGAIMGSLLGLRSRRIDMPYETARRIDDLERQYQELQSEVTRRRRDLELIEIDRRRGKRTPVDYKRARASFDRWAKTVEARYRELSQKADGLRRNVAAWQKKTAPRQR